MNSHEQRIQVPDVQGNRMTGTDAACPRDRASRFRNPPRAWSCPTITLALGVLLASCATGPDYKRPELDTPDKYKSAISQEAAETGLASDWWRLFNDLDLNALEEEAIEANQDLRAAMARVTQARASASSIKSEFFPKVTMDASTTRSRRPNTSTSDSASAADKINQVSSVVNQVSSLVRQIGSLGQSSTTTGTTGAATTGTSTTSGSTSTTASSSTGTISNSHQIAFDLSYEVDIWGRVRRSCQSARAQIKASEYEMEVVRQTLLADVAQDYFNLRLLDAQNAILAENLALYQEQVDLTEQKCKAGLTSEIDYLQAKVQLESARADIVDIRRQRADLEHAVAILLGRAPSDFSLEPRPLEGAPPVIPAGMPADILRRRPDVAEAEQNLAAACAEIGVAKAEFFPTVKLTGSAGFESTDIESVVDWRNRVWSIGPSVSLPIFEAGKLRANLREAKARYMELDAAYRQTVLAAFGDVEDSLTDLHLRAEQSDAQGKALDAAREYHRLTKIQYDVGVVDYLQLINAEQTLLSNELSAVKILNQRMVCTVLLVKAIGSGWDAQPAGTAEEARLADASQATANRGKE